MAEKDSGDDTPSLEMPSLGFGRTRKRKRETSQDEPAGGPAAVPEATPGDAEEPEPRPEPGSGPVEEAEPAPERTEVLEPVPVGATAPPLFADEAPTRRDVGERPVDHATEDPDLEAAAADDEPVDRKRRREFALPAIGGLPAAILTGAVVGVLTVGLTWASLRLCEVVQGTSSCGNPGFFLLLAIMIAMVLTGGALLRAFGVPDPGSTSFLGMGLVAVIVLLFLVELLFAWWMILVIPAAAMAAYALAHWVTTAFVEPVENNMHR